VELGKSVRLELSGEGIELDRAILEELVDPILHLLRNAVDHGIEDPAERIRAGKPAEGVITLSAERRRDVVELRVEDDGRGVNRDRVLARARQLGLFAPGAEVTLDDAGLLRVLAHPGFSLKAGVTQVSGRGVGIDAAVATVRAAGGRVSLESELGQGTRFTLTLPLTAAIQRVLLVGVEQERCAVPFGLVSEAIRAPLLEPGRFSFRGESVPLVDLRDAMALPSSRPDRKRQVLMLDWGGETHRGALAVDTLLGQHDVVVERIEEPAGMPRWLSAATILPDGSPAFLLDPTALF
jgi:two-component system chemotaxis sensor kinase CheA